MVEFSYCRISVDKAGNLAPLVYYLVFGTLADTMTMKRVTLNIRI